MLRLGLVFLLLLSVPTLVAPTGQQQQHLTKQEQDAYGSIISYLSSSTSGHLLVRSSSGGSNREKDDLIASSDEDSLWLVKDGYKHKTTPAEHKHSHGSHTPILTQSEIDAIPSSTDADTAVTGSQDTGIGGGSIGGHQKHIKPLLCATYLPDDGASADLDVLRKNIQSTGKNCEWAIVSSSDSISSEKKLKGVSITANHYIQAPSSTTKDETLMFIALYNVSSFFHRVWLVDRHILISSCDISRFFVLGEISFWPHPPPLAVSPLVKLTTTARSTGIILSRHAHIMHSYWFPKGEESEAADNTTKVIAYEAEALPISETALALESSFFRWFGKFLVEETWAAAERDEDSTNSPIASLESILCIAARIFGDLKAVKYPCAVVSAKGTHVMRHMDAAEQQQEAKDKHQHVPKLGHFPSLQRSLQISTALGSLYIGPNFTAVYKQALLNTDTSIKRPPRVALHVTHVATNVVNTHKLHRRMSVNIFMINQQANFGKLTETEAEDVCKAEDSSSHTDAATWNKWSHHNDKMPRLVAFYFPQFHQDPLNDKIW